MATKKPPPPDAQAPAPTAEPGSALVKPSKLALAMGTVNESITKIQALGTTLDELERESPANTAFEVSTKAGYKLADGVRKKARETRLAIKALRTDGTTLLNSLKTEFWAVADPAMDKLQAIEDNAKDQIAAEDSKDETRKENHKKNIAAINALAEGLSTMTVEEVDARAESLAALIVDDSYEEFQQAATEAKITVRGIIAEGRTQAQARADAAEQQRKRDEDAEKLRKANEAREAITQKIRDMRTLPDSAIDTGHENIGELLRVHRATVPNAETYGDQLEFAELVHAEVAGKLKAMYEAAQEPSDAGDVTSLVDDHHEVSTEHPGALSNLPHGEARASDDDLPFDIPAETPPPVAPVPAEATKSEALRTALDQIDVQFGKTVIATTPEPEADVFFVTHSPAPAPRMRPVLTNVAPTPAPAVPDLLEAAKEVCVWYAQLPGNVTIELQDATTPSVSNFVTAMAALKQAVIFVNEFAD